MALIADAPTAHRYDYKEIVLDNGLRVVTLEDSSCPIVAVQIWYHVGSKDESKDRNGFAHMFEHMMFRGTDRLGSADHFDLIQGVGGSCNAYTAFDNTTYINVGPSNQLPLLLWLEAERLSSLKIDEGGFQTERRVVEEERRMGLNSPYGSVFEKVFAEVFPGHPYSWSPIGNIPHLRAAGVDELQEFWDRFYVPNNASLIIVGDVDHAKAQELAQQYFGWIPRCPEPPRVSPPKTLRKGPFEIRIQEKNGPVPIVGVGYYAVPSGHADSAALEVLSAILGEGESSRLHRALVKEKKLAAMAISGTFQLEHAGVFGAGAALSPFGNAKKALAALDEEFTRVREKGVTDKELLKARNNLLKRSLASQLRVESKAQLLGDAAAILGDTEDANRKLGALQSVTRADVQRVARLYCVPERSAKLTIKPTLMGMLGSILSMGRKGGKGEEAELAPVNEAGRRASPGGPKATARRPPGLPERPPIAPPLETVPALAVEKSTLANGLEVVVVEDHEVPLVSLYLGLRYGASSEPPGRPGTASMACSMLTKGTATRSADRIADDLETYAIDLSGSAGRDTAAVIASALSGQLERAVEALAEVVTEPTFPEEELATLVRMVTTGMMVEEKSPSTIADREFDRLIYGSHPYARPVDGRVNDIKQLKRDDLAAWWSVHARPDAAVLYVAGDMDAKSTIATVEKYLGAWRAPEAAAPVLALPRIPDPAATRIYLVDHPGARQSEIRVGHLGKITRHSSDHATAAVLNQIFGSSFGARLNSTLRVDKGLTYGIRGGFSWRQRAGWFGVSTFTKTPKTAEAVSVILAEVDRLLVEPPSNEEMIGARNFLTGSFSRRRETPQALLDDLWTVESEGLADDFYERWLKTVAGAASKGVAAVAERHVRRDLLTIVVVGEAKKVRADLEKIAEVVVVDKKKAK